MVTTCCKYKAKLKKTKITATMFIIVPVAKYVEKNRDRQTFPLNSIQPAVMTLAQIPSKKELKNLFPEQRDMIIQSDVIAPLSPDSFIQCRRIVNRLKKGSLAH